MAREAAIVTACQRELTARGAWWINVHGNGVGRAGIPDLIACLNDGRFLAIECKSPKGKLRPLQAHELQRIHAAAGIGVVIRHIDELRQLLGHLETMPGPATSLLTEGILSRLDA